MMAVLLAVATAATNIVCPEGTVLRIKHKPIHEEWCVKTDFLPYPVKHGPFKRWWSNGRLRDKGKYFEDEFHGRQTRMSEAGTPIRIEEYSHGVADGLWEEFDPTTGVKLSHEYFNQGRLHGLEWQWHRNGQLAAEFRWQNGVRHGDWAEWDQAGGLRNTGVFAAGVKVGVWTYRRADGATLMTVVHEPDGTSFHVQVPLSHPIIRREKIPVENVAVGGHVVHREAVERFLGDYAQTVAAECELVCRPVQPVSLQWRVVGSRIRFPPEIDGIPIQVGQCIADAISGSEFPYNTLPYSMTVKLSPIVRPSP